MCLTHEVLPLSNSMCREMGVQHVSDNLKVDGRQNNIPETKAQMRWEVPVAVVAGVLFASAFFGVGFAIGYYAVPAGRYSGVHAAEYIAF